MRNTFNFSFNKYILIAIFTILLSACGGDGGDDNSSNSGPTAEGTILLPSTLTDEQIAAAGIILADLENCLNLPAGYIPIPNTTIDFLNAIGTVLSSTTTDACGQFNASVGEEVVNLVVNIPGFQEIVSDIDAFTGNEPGLVSTIPDDATYEIASLQASGESGDSVAFSVTDSQTNTAVIGLPDDAVTINLNGVPIALVDISLASDVAEPASVTMVLDASGSMSSRVEDKNGDDLIDDNGATYDRFRITALAAHAYLDGMPNTDETAVIPFGSDVHFINDAYIADNLSIEDSSGNPASYTFSEDGFTSSSSDLRFIVDSYNESSQLYRDINPDARHPLTPNLSIDSYEYGGGTSLYDGIEEGLENLSTRSTSRKLVIAMSDGQNNSSSITREGVIDSAVAKGIPVYTITFLGTSGGENMEQIALGTNASYYEVAGFDFQSIFQTIQTGITFQYIAMSNTNFAEGDTITVTVEVNGQTVSRDLTL